MTDIKKIKTAFERNAKALSLRPAIGQGTAVTKVRVCDGLTCEIADGPWKIVADMGEKHGGNNAGPNPGVLGRGALGSCLAISYMHWAAKLDIPITNLEVEIQADYDARGEYGVVGVPVGYSEIRYLVRVESPAAEDDIRRMLEKAETHTPYLDVFCNPQNMKREVDISKKEA